MAGINAISTWNDRDLQLEAVQFVFLDKVLFCFQKYLVPMAYLLHGIVNLLHTEHWKSFRKVDVFKHVRNGIFTFNFVDQFIFQSFFVDFRTYYILLSNADAFLRNIVEFKCHETPFFRTQKSKNHKFITVSVYFLPLLFIIAKKDIFAI